MPGHILKLLVAIGAALIGAMTAVGILLLLLQVPLPPTQRHHLAQVFGVQKPEVIGFLPYWLVTKAKQDYSQYLTQVSYFGLVIGPDGKVVQKDNPQETEPGWSRLNSTSLQQFFAPLVAHQVEKSLLVHNSTESDIRSLIQDPVGHADNLLADVIPIMQRDHYTDLNVDIESFRTASPAAQLQFTRFIQRLHDQLHQRQVATLTLDVPSTAFVKETVLSPNQVQPYLDKAIIMAYDFHTRGSYLAGPVAPLSGGGDVRDIDVTQVIQEAVKSFSARKVILGAPLYGYGWDTIEATPGAAVVPSTGITVSAQQAQAQLANCQAPSCTTGFDTSSQEPYFISQLLATGSAQQVWYEDQSALRHKLELAQQYHLGGVALWALGYEDASILQPLKAYKSQVWWE